MSALVHKNLLRVVQGIDGEPRIGMLEALREYALERLEASSEREEIRRRHATYCLALVAHADEEFQNGHEQATWLARLEQDHDNVRAALCWAHESGESEFALRLAWHASRFWLLHGHVHEGCKWLHGSIAVARNQGVSAKLLADALHAAATLMANAGDLDQAEVLFQECLDLYRDLEVLTKISKSLMHLGLIACSRGDFERAKELYEQSFALTQEQDDQWAMAIILNNLAEADYYRGDCVSAVESCQHSLALYQTVGNT